MANESIAEQYETALREAKITALLHAVQACQWVSVRELSKLVRENNLNMVPMGRILFGAPPGAPTKERVSRPAKTRIKKTRRSNRLGDSSSGSLNAEGFRSIEIMTADDVAALLHVNRKTIYKEVKYGRIPHRKIGRRLIFERRAVVAWLQNEQNASIDGVTGMHSEVIERLRKKLAITNKKLLATQEELRKALSTIDSIAPRPWEAMLDPGDGPVDDLDEEELDDCEWIIVDANDDNVDWSFGSNIPSNGKWARGWVEDVNALGACLNLQGLNGQTPNDVMGVAAKRQSILDFLKEHGGWYSLEDIQAVCGGNISSVKMRLNQLIESGAVDYKGKGTAKFTYIGRSK